MEQEDEELEQLLGEIPRATSAPPHLEELQRAYGPQLEDSPFVSYRETELAVKPFTDIRCDEHYEQFYRAYSGAQKLPPPMDNRTIYNDLPTSCSPKSASNALSPFYSGLTLDSPPASLQQQRQRQFELQHKVQSQVQNQQGLHPMTQTKQQSVTSDLIMSSKSQQQRMRDEHALATAFGNLGFDERSSSTSSFAIAVSSHSRQQMHDENVGSNGMPDGLVGSLSNGRGTPASNGLYSHLDQYVQKSPDYGSAASLDGFVTRSQSAMDLLSRSSGLESLGNGSYGNGSYSGLDDFSSGPTAQTSAQTMIEKLLRRGSPQQSDDFSAGRSLDPYAMGSAAQQQNQILLQRHQQHLDVYSAASMQATRIYPAPFGNGNEVYSSQTPLQQHQQQQQQQQQHQQQQQQQQLGSEYEMTVFEAQRHALIEQAHRLQLQMDQEEKQKQMQLLQKHLIFQQQAQETAAYMASLQAQANGGQASFLRAQSPLNAASRQSLQQSPAVHTFLLSNHALMKQQQRQQQHQLNHHQLSHEIVWNHPHLPPSASVAAALNQMDRAQVGSQVGNLCRYYAQGYCSRGDACPFLHPGASQGYGSVRVPQTLSGALKDVRASSSGSTERSRSPAGPEKILSRRNGPRNGQTGVVAPVASVRKRPEILTNGHSNGHVYSNGHQSPSPVHSSPFLPDAANHTRVVVSPDQQVEFDVSNIGAAHHLQQQQSKYTTLEEVEGRFYSIAKDQHGCRFLQRKFEEGGPEDVQKIFVEIIDHIIELMTDPFGNYLIQKLLDVCDESQRMQILSVVAEGSQLVTISLNMHGTRAVQKLIETLKSSEQVAMVKKSLQPGVVTLIKDLNGNHVVQRCLQRLSNEDSVFIFEAAATHCVEIATHRHGCCVLQRCVDFAKGVHKERLVSEIAANALILSQDPFGNYVVQYILDLGTSWASMEVMVRLEGNYPYLAAQKFSSNVVEKCLKLAGEENRACIVRELVGSSRLGQLLQDPYANYVIQSALQVAKGSLHAVIVEAIRPHLPALRSSPYGKRILARTNLKK